MDQFAQCAGVLAVREGAVECRESLPAKRTPAFAVQRSGIQKRRPALRTEVLGDERLRFLKTFGADWNPGEIVESSAANAAIVGKDQVEQCCGQRPQRGDVERGLIEL
jgi:hypothetical protein